MAPRLSLAIVLVAYTVVQCQEPSLGGRTPGVIASSDLAAPDLVPIFRTDAQGDPLPAAARVRLGSIRYRPGGPVAAAALSPDGKWIASTSGSDVLTLSDPKTGKEITQLRVPGGYGATFLTFSPDSQNIAVLGYAPFLHIVAIPSGKLVSKVQVPQPNNSRLSNIAFSGDGKVVAAGTDNFGQSKNFVHAWETATGKPLQSVEVVQNSQIRAALSHDGAVLATSGYYSPRNAAEGNPDQGRTIQLWDTRNGRMLRKLVVERNPVIAIAVSPDGKTIAAASGAATFHLFDADSGKEVRRFAGRRGHTQILQFAPDGKTLFACSADGAVQRWDAASGNRLGLAEGPRLFSLAFPSPGQVWALGMESQAFTLWDVVNDKSLAAAGGHAAGVGLLAFTDNGKILVTGSGDGKLCWWDTATGHERGRRTIRDEEGFRGYLPANRAGGYALSRDGRYLAAACDYGNGTIRLHNLATGKIVCDFDAPRSGGSAEFAFSPDNARLAAISVDGVHIWDVTTGQELQALPLKSKREDSYTSSAGLAFSPNGKTIAAARCYRVGSGGVGVPSFEGEVYLWNLDTGTEIARIEGVSPASRAMAFSPSGQLLVLPTPDHGALLIKTATGKEIGRLKSSSAYPMAALAFSPDGRLLAGSSPPENWSTSAADFNPDHRVVVWELTSREIRHEFLGHRGAVLNLAFSPDGGTLASASADTTVLLWDVSGKREQPSPASESAAEAAWNGLADPNAMRAYQACMTGLINSPDAAVKVLGHHLEPARAANADPAEVARLISNLDNDKFTERARATAALGELGDIAGPAMQKALLKPATLEAERRLKVLLDRLDRSALPDELVRQVRAIEVLERIASAEARALLSELAGGAPQHRLTREAAAALGRLTEN